MADKLAKVKKNLDDRERRELERRRKGVVPDKTTDIREPDLVKDGHPQDPAP
jgi:hypothetical protein